MDGNGPLLVDTGRGLSLKYRGRFVYSARDPLAAPRQAALSAPLVPGTLYVVPSPCLGHGLEYLVGRLPESSAVICLEAEEPLRGLALEAIARAEPSTAEAAGSRAPRRRIALCAPADAVDTYRALEASLAPARFRRAVEVRLSGGRAFAAGDYDAALSAIDADISVRYRNRLSLVRMGRLWTRNVFANLSSMRWEEVGTLCGDGRPVVVCGAGPSLDGAIKAVRRCRDGVTVLACDTAAGALAAAGIQPDIIVCLEGQVYNVADFLPLDGARARLVVDLSAHPSSCRAVDGPKSLVLSEWTGSVFLSRLAAAGLPVSIVPPLGSVGVLALRIARSLGGPVIVAGLDFSFPPGRTHCSGSPSDLQERRLESRTYRRGNAWAATFREGASRSGGTIVDPALSMYASLAAAELSGAQVWDLRAGRVAPLPARPLSAEGLEALVSEYKAAGARAAPEAAADSSSDSGETGTPAAWRKRAAGFIAGELERSERVASALRHGASGAELRVLLADADFLYLHFPDPERVGSLERDALKRVAAEAAYWRSRLEAALVDAGGA